MDLDSGVPVTDGCYLFTAVTAIIRVKTVISLRGGSLLLLLSVISHLEERFWMLLSFLIDTTDDEGEK